MGRKHWAFLSAATAAATAQVALADVKAGVESWTRGDYAAAIREWQEPAAKGDADAQFNLGQAYKLGRGVKQDLAKAEELFRRAADAGHLQAGDNYGLLLFQRGERRKALPYIVAASDRGDPRAMYLLGIAHFNGDIVARDWVRAYALETLAQQAGLQQAGTALAQMDQHIPLDQRQQAAAMATELSEQMQATRSRQFAAADLDQQEVGPLPAPSAPVLASKPPATAILVPPASAPDTSGPRTAGADYARPQSPLAKLSESRSTRSMATAPAGSGGWRVQLGAFGIPANADALWNRIGTRQELAGRSKLLVPVGRVVKLQASGYASKSEAQSACSRLAAAGIACMAVRD